MPPGDAPTMPPNAKRMGGRFVLWASTHISPPIINARVGVLLLIRHDISRIIILMVKGEAVQGVSPGFFENSNLENDGEKFSSQTRINPASGKSEPKDVSRFLATARTPREKIPKPKPTATARANQPFGKKL